MIDGGLSPLYRAALAGPHHAFTQVDVWRSGELIAQAIPWIDGSVQATLQNRTTRNLTMTVDPALYDSSQDGLLAPFGNELRVTRGLQFAEGTRFAFPVFRGKIATDAMTSDGRYTVTANDRADEVVGAEMAAPENSVVGQLVTIGMRTLISEGLPDAVFGPSDRILTTLPQLTWQSRGQALDEMATSVNAFWYPLADGEFVIRQVPWTVLNDPVVTLRDAAAAAMAGDSTSALITQATWTRSRAAVRNAVAVSGERADGSTPVSGYAEDDDPTSPTYVRGPFGLRLAQVQLNTPTQPDAADYVARSLLRTGKSLTEAWTVSIVPDASLELGDCLRLEANGRSVTQVIAGMTVPFGASAMQLTMRAQVVASLAGVGQTGVG